MGVRFIVVAIAFMALASPSAHASDPSPLQDFCVAVNDSIANDFLDSVCEWKDLQESNGTLYVGFILSNNLPSGSLKNKLFTKILYPGDVFVFPQGLIHFQLNVGKSNAVAFAALSSQDPRIITIASNIFGSNPPINPEVFD